MRIAALGPVGCGGGAFRTARALEFSPPADKWRPATIPAAFPRPPNCLPEWKAWRCVPAFAAEAKRSDSLRAATETGGGRAWRDRVPHAATAERCGRTGRRFRE